MAAALARIERSAEAVARQDRVPGQAAVELFGRVGRTAGAQHQVVRLEQRSDHLRLIRTERCAALAGGHDLDLHLERSQPIAQKVCQAAGYSGGVRFEAGRRLQNAGPDRRRHLTERRGVDAAGNRRRLARAKQNDRPRRSRRTVLASVRARRAPTSSDVTLIGRRSGQRAALAGVADGVERWPRRLVGIQQTEPVLFTGRRDVADRGVVEIEHGRTRDPRILDTRRPQGADQVAGALTRRQLLPVERAEVDRGVFERAELGDVDGLWCAVPLHDRPELVDLSKTERLAAWIGSRVKATHVGVNAQRVDTVPAARGEEPIQPVDIFDGPADPPVRWDGPPL